jgi:hypothetical protein
MTPKTERKREPQKPRKKPARPPALPRPKKTELSDDDILEFLDDGTAAPAKEQPPRKKKAPRGKKRRQPSPGKTVGEDEFWDLDI